VKKKKRRSEERRGRHIESRSTDHAILAIGKLGKITRPCPKAPKPAQSAKSLIKMPTSD